jgi:hypothetical protein
MAIPEIKIKVGADTAGLDRGMSKAGQSLVRFSKIAAGAIAVLPGALLALGRSSMNVVDAQAKLAKQLGATTTGVQTMQRAADLSGVSMGALQSASERLNRTLGEVARTGEGRAFEALERVGLSAERLANLDADERLAVLSDAIKTAGMSAVQAADFLAQLGIRQGEVARMMLDGGDAIRSAREQVDLYGVSISKIDAERIQQANDKWSEFGLMMRGIGNQIAVQMAPIMTEIADRFRRIIEDAGGIRAIVAPAFEALFRAVKLVSDNMGVLIRVATVLIGLKLAAVAINIGVAFVRLAMALRTATVAAIAMKAVQGGLVKGAVVVAGSLGLIATAAGQADTLFNALGINTDAVTKSLKDFTVEAGGAEGALARLAAAQREAAGMINGSAPILDSSRFTGGKGKPGDKPPGGGGGGGGGAAQTDPLEHQREMIAQRLALIREGFMTEQELLMQKYEEDRNIIDGYFQTQMEQVRGNQELERQLAQEHNSLMEQLEEQHQGKLAAIRQAGFNSAMTGTAQVFNSLGRLVQSGGKKNVKMAKAFGIAEALISTFVAANKAMAFAATAGPAAAFGAYASVAAKGLAAVASIRSISDTGGGGGGASAGGGSFSDSSSSGRSGGGADRSVYVTLQGQSFGRDQVRDLLDQINEYVADGGRVVLA